MLTDSTLELVLCDSPTTQTAPLMAFPSELLTKIFWHATYLDPNREPFSDWKKFSILQAVCSRWRDILRSSPEIRLLVNVGYEREIPAHFPCERLGSLSLDETSPEYAMRIMSLCPNLTNFYFGHEGYTDDKPYDCDDPDDLPHSGCVTMSSIRRLWWVDRSSIGSGYSIMPMKPHFFINFRFPALEILRWTAPLPEDDSSTSPVHSFFESMTKLRDLEIRPAKARAYHSIDQYLHVFRNVTKFVVKLSQEWDSGLGWLQKLTIRPGATCSLFPQLEGLKIVVGEPTLNTLCDGLIVALYSRRYHPVDWASRRQSPDDLTLPTYDATSSHWSGNTQLRWFWVVGDDDCRYMRLDWENSVHYSVLETMFKDASKVSGFKGDTPGSLISF